jgi:hypothetical protein
MYIYIYCALVGTIKDSMSQNARCNSEKFSIVVSESRGYTISIRNNKINSVKVCICL